MASDDMNKFTGLRELKTFNNYIILKDQWGWVKSISSCILISIIKIERIQK